MKISCEIVKDLLPLYYDDVCSNESRTTVEEHLQECDTCKKYLDNMNGDFIQTNADKAAEQAKSNILKGIKKKLLRKNVMISAISIICAIVVLLGGFSFIFHYEIPISYENGLVSVEMGNDGMIDVSFNGDDYHCSYTLTKPIERNGEEQYIVYIYYTDSIWTKYFSKPQKGKEYKYTINNISEVDYDDSAGPIQVKKDISAVYYLIGSYREIAQLSNKEFDKVAKNAVLIWEK